MSCSVLDLPELVLVKVFSFLDISQLIRTIPLVCKKWREEVSKESFWKAQRCLSLDEEEVKVQLMAKFLGKCPNLRFLKICLPDDGSSILLALTRPSFPYLRTFIFKGIGRHEETGICNIIKNAPLLSNVTLRGDITGPMIEATSHLKELVSLSFSDFFIDEDKMLLITKIFENTTRLERVSIDTCEPECEVGGLLVKLIKKHSETLRCISWFMPAFDEDVQHLKMCPLISELKLCFEYCSDQSLQSLKQMSQLVSLSLHCNGNFTSNGFKRLFGGKAFPNLKNLVITKSGGLGKTAVKVLAENCPSLETLYFENCYNVTDEGMEHVARNCQKLRVLKIHGINTDFSFVKSLHLYVPALKCLCLFGEPMTGDVMENFTKLHPNFKSKQCVPIKHIDYSELYNRHMKNTSQTPVVVMFYNNRWIAEMCGHAH